MLLSAAFRAAGGFDEGLFPHMGDVALCWRLRRTGWRIGYTSRATVYHVGGGALGYGSPRKTYLNFRNSLCVLTKNLRSRWIGGRIIRRQRLGGFSAPQFLLAGEAGHAWVVGRAGSYSHLPPPTGGLVEGSGVALSFKTKKVHQSRT